MISLLLNNGADAHCEYKVDVRGVLRMAKNINVVLSGLYTGKEIIKSTNKKFAFVSGGGYINKLYVESVTPLNQSSVNNIADASLGQAVFGPAGAIAGMNQKQIIAEIVWKNGAGKSLIKVDSDIYEAIVVGMYEQVTEKEQEAMAKSDERHQMVSGVLAVAIIIFGTLIYCFPELF